MLEAKVEPSDNLKIGYESMIVIYVNGELKTKEYVHTVDATKRLSDIIGEMQL